MENKKHLPILIYYNFRGLLQPIRNLLCYLDISYFEIYIEEFESQKKTFDQSLLRMLSGAKVDKTQLPALIHRGETIYQVLPIMAYLCYTCQRQDLLGSSLQKRTRVQQIMEVCNNHHLQTMSGVLALPEYVLTHQQPFIDAHLTTLYHQIIGRPGYVREICDHIQAHRPRQYILGELTIIDFIFLETCIYLVGCFNKLERVSPHQEPAISSKSALLLEDVPFEYLRTMRSYQETIMKQPFYLKHQKYLESFSFISKLTNLQRVAGFKKMWHGNPWLAK